MKKINTTKNYGLFSLSQVNRPIDLKKHAGLKASMLEYGFLEEFPIVCLRDDNKNLIVWDGQHRFTIAQMLGLPIHWVEATSEFNVSKVNGGQRAWVPRDHAESWSRQGRQDYTELLLFCDQNNVSTGRGASLLAGTATFNNIIKSFIAGDFKIVDKTFAQQVAMSFTSITRINKLCNSARLIEALMAVHRVAEVDPERLAERIAKCPEMIKQHGTRDAYLTMIEDIYNFRKQTTLPVKFLAEKEMRLRNPAISKAAKQLATSV